MIQISYAQTDSVDADIPGWINRKYMQDIYNPETRSVNASYNYSNNWDLDGDNKKDSLFFIGNGGVHTYFYLRVMLSSDHVVRDFTFIQLDMPYLQDKKLLEKYGRNPGIQFVVSDFDKDGIPDLYLNFNNSFGYIPKSFWRKGITTKCILMNFSGSKLKVRNSLTFNSNEH